MRWMRYGQIAVAILLLTAPLGCGEEGGTAPPGADPPEPPVLFRDISSHCYRWPGATFTRLNFAQVYTSMAPGELAVDFELEDVEGKHYRLSELLMTRPVLLVLGSFT